MTNRHLLEVALDNAEVLVDKYVDNDFVKEIPILGSALKLVTAASDIRDRIFAAKVARFLTCLDSISNEKKESLRKKIQGSHEEANKVGEIVLLTLDRLTDLEKPEIISMVFLAYVDGHLKETDFRRVVEAIDLAFVDDLRRLFSIHNPPKKPQDAYLRYLVRTGLTEVVAGNTFDEAGELYYELSSLGTKALNAYRHGRKIVR